MNGYFAVELDKASCNVVKKRETMPNVVSDHITLAYKPVKKVYDKYSKLVGKKVGAFIISISSGIGKSSSKNAIAFFWFT